MGQLRFDQIECELLAPNAALVLGSWHLDIQGERKNGNFSLVLRKFDGRWLIIHDHSSTLVENE
jgi:ketosteroid isomerase-like protein